MVSDSDVRGATHYSPSPSSPMILVVVLVSTQAS
ncbi:hypothetical protein Zm00014a_038861 [Zea mays]|uniref:Uncharacterized protein n=1 Tax=Zea mays TaxID=4577 RepID=A0A3L6EZ46_MAIZE|nr:hypothetical protein Zm00014a_038861 [Zea mays]